MAKNDIVVRFVSDSHGDKAIAKQGNRENANVSQRAIIEMLQESVGKGTFISGKVQKQNDGNTLYIYTLKEDNGKKGTIIINTDPRYYGESDANINELRAISERGNSIKYWNKTKMVASLILVGGITFGAVTTIGFGLGKVIYEADKSEQEYQQDDYVAELNKAREENGAKPIEWSYDEKTQFERDKSQSNKEYYEQNDIYYQFGNYFEEEQEEKGRSL